MKYDPDALPFWDDGNGAVGKRVKEAKRIADAARLKEVRHARRHFLSGDVGLSLRDRAEKRALEIEEAELEFRLTAHKNRGNSG